MIQVETKFPNPGSIAEHDGDRCRILQHLPGDIVLLSRLGGTLGHVRRAPLCEVIDPSDDNVREKAVQAGMGEADTRRALWIARHLRDRNETTLQDLDRAMHVASGKGDVPVCYDRGHLSRILRKLGWSPLRRRNGSGLMVTDYVRTALASAA